LGEPVNEYEDMPQGEYVKDYPVDLNVLEMVMPKAKDKE